MSEPVTLTPFRGEDPPPDPDWVIELFNATTLEEIEAVKVGAPLQSSARQAADWDETKHPKGEGGRFVETTGGKSEGDTAQPTPELVPPKGSVADPEVCRVYLEDNPPLPNEDVFIYQGRIAHGMSQEDQSALLMFTRERYEPVAAVAAGADRWCAEHGLAEIPRDIIDRPVDIAEANAVAVYFEQTADMSGDPEVAAAYEDFKRQNDEMYDFMTKPESEGGLGMTVSYTNKSDPYETAAAQAEDVRQNNHITIESGLGGSHGATMTTEEYDRFRAVHDVFGHVAIGGGFDRHGEYEAWLMHAAMYDGPGRQAMSTEYHGVNSALWAGDPNDPGGTGKSILLPEEYGIPPWERSTAAALAAAEPIPAGYQLMIDELGLDAHWANHHDPWPWHFNEEPKGVPPRYAYAWDESLHPREHGKFSSSEGSSPLAEAVDHAGARVEATIALEKLLPGATVNLGNMHGALAPQLVQSVERFGKEFPRASEQIRSIEVKEGMGRTLGSWTPATGALALNGQMFGATPLPEGLSKSFEDRRTGVMQTEMSPAGSFHPLDDAQSTFDHELGHVVFDTANRESSAQLRESEGDPGSLWFSGGKQYEEDFSARLMGFDPQQYRDSANTYGKPEASSQPPTRTITNALRSMGSKYGALSYTAKTGLWGEPSHSINEGFAEWFSVRQREEMRSELGDRTKPIINDAFEKVIDYAKSARSAAMMAAPDPGGASTCYGYIPSEDWEAMTPEERAALFPPSPEDPITAAVDSTPTKAQIKASIDRLHKQRERVGRKLLAGAEVAFAEALRRAGVKIVTRTRARGTSKTVQAQVRSVLTSGASVRPLLGALGLREQDILAQAFTTYEEQAGGWLADYRKRQLAEIVRLGLDPADFGFEEGTSTETVRNTAAVAMISSGLMALARGRLLGGIDHVMPGEVAGAVPASLVLGGIRVAEGRATATLGTPDEMPQLVEHPELEDVESGLAALVEGETMYTWVHAFYGDPTSPFEPHEDLGVSEFTTADRFTDPDLANGEAFPPGDYYQPGDHDGCTCEWVVSNPGGA